MNKAVAILKKGEGRALKAGGMWIYDNEIAHVEGEFADGDILEVHDFDGYPLGKGYINRHSKIRIRMMTRNIRQEIDTEFLRRRVTDAWEYRKRTVDTESCRLIFGEADFLPGLVVDKLMGQQEIVIKSLGKFIGKSRIISGATILGDGEVALILDANVLI